ncbi:MAG: succinate dehydrogenase flavoprotein subunit [Planctomycetes bacterium ADurb.Bin401]|nr:MAG: succinate dehydrogenase flavoprotein subunit [Planctomycetes bacterium ADurb.Bin401]
MQVIPRIFSTDANGKDEREFLTPFFPSMSKMATDIFLKGYQWPFDPQRIENLQSSLIDILVFNENQKGRRVFMDFLHNPIGGKEMSEFKIEDLEPEALNYLKATGAMQKLPIERLEHMNRPAIDIYKEHDIDLYTEPLEISVCSQHNNGGFAIDKWWQSNIKRTFVIGEMAGSHGIKRPGGSALNAGQVGASRAAEYIVNVYADDTSNIEDDLQVKNSIEKISKLFCSDSDLIPQQVISEIQHRMTTFAGHIRKSENAQKALSDAIELHKKIQSKGFNFENPKDFITAIQAEHLAFSSIGYLKVIVELLNTGSGSRGSHLVLTDDGIEIHPDVKDPDNGKSLKFKPENKDLRNSIIRIQLDENTGIFECRSVPVRSAPKDRKAFEPAWTDYRQGKIYN